MNEEQAFAIKLGSHIGKQSAQLLSQVQTLRDVSSGTKMLDYEKTDWDAQLFSLEAAARLAELSAIDKEFAGTGFSGHTEEFEKSTSLLHDHLRTTIMLLQKHMKEYQALSNEYKAELDKVRKKQ